MKNILVVDGEWNTSEDGIIQPKEIGVALVINAEEDTVQAAKPERHSIMPVSEDRHDALSVSQVLLNLGSNDLVWASYGWFDNVQLRGWFEREGIAFPMGTTHVDVASLYTALHRLPRSVKLKHAVENECGRFLGAQHHADDDAWNTARLLAVLMNRYEV